MQPIRSHIIIIGFKNSGKSLVGRSLASKIQAPFIDLDEVIEANYRKELGVELNCQQIVQANGEDYFRDLELKSLSQSVDSTPSVISLGGGAANGIENQNIIQPHIVIYIQTKRGIAYERMLMSGVPTFFKPNESLLESFNKLYDEREEVYKKIRHYTVKNDGLIDSVVNQIIININEHENINKISDNDPKFRHTGG